MDKIFLSILWYGAFIFATTVHEASHAFFALRFGDRTAYHSGQVSLNPLPHMRREPVGMIVVPLLTLATQSGMIGWASTPIDVQWAQRHPKYAALVRLAGPLSNLVLAVLAGLLIHLCILMGFFYAPDSIGNPASVVESVSDGALKGLAVMLSIMFSLNIMLFVLNLIPIAPLDGTALAELILPYPLLQGYRSLMSQPFLGFFGIFIAWYILGRIYHPIYNISLNILYPGSGYQ